MTDGEMPRYKCHKEVWALKIANVIHVGGKLAQLVFEDTGYAPINVSLEWLDKRGASCGGYYVVYKDGYTSFSPAEAFEDGYTLIGE